MSHPPGASYHISNALIIAKRAALGLEPPVRLKFSQTWSQSNPLFEWYQRRGDRTLIRAMQLRKERKSPFFHEYIAFSLQDSGGFFRMDRRQQPDENTPLDSIYTHGVEPFDTIEEVSSLDDGLYGSSDCLIEIEFKSNTKVHLALLLKICHAICQHKHSSVYTLQRYNCYFFAQTIILCTACAASNWDGTSDIDDSSQARRGQWTSPNSSDTRPLLQLESVSASGRWPQEPFSGSTGLSSANFKYDWSHLSKLAQKVIQISPFLKHADACTHCRDSQSLHRQRSLSSEIDRLKAALSTYWNDVFHQYLVRVCATNYHSIVQSGIWTLRVDDGSEEEWKRLVTSESSTIESKWRDYYQQALASLTTVLRDLLEPTEICDAWEPEPDIWEAIWASNFGVPFQRLVKEWEDQMAGYFASTFSGVQQSLNNQATTACSEAHNTTIKMRVDSFEQRMVIKVNVMTRADPNFYAAQASELEQNEFIETLVTGEYNTPLIQRVRGTVERWTKKAKYGNTMETSSFEDMQEFLNMLIHAHSIRVEQYKFWLKCTSTEVKHNIQETMNDVWNTITNTQY